MGKKTSIFLINFFAISLLVYFFMNGGAYWRILRYNLFLNTFASNDLKNGDILDIKSSADVNVGTSTKSKAAWTLVIPKIEVTTPIVVPINETKQGILASLEEGVGIYPGSVAVGKQGRIVILGHSSRASWYRGNYGYIFSLIHNLKEYDKFYIIGGGKKYTYEIFSNKVLSPQNTNIFLSTTPTDSEVDLVTCYPIGSSSQRTIIQAKLIGEENIQ